MKRDLDLIRQLLLVIENSETSSLQPRLGLSPSDHRVQYHLRLLVDAGLARGVGLTGDGSVCVRLTWDGHELLELIRNDALWERAKRLVHEKTGGNCIAAIRSAMTRWAELSVADEERWPVRMPPYGSSQPAAPAGSNGNGANGNGHGHAASPTVNRLPAMHRLTDNAPASSTNRAAYAHSNAPEDSAFQFSVWTGNGPDRGQVYLL